jgi:hypothetical protein
MTIVRRLLLPVVFVCFLAACQPAPTKWKDIPPDPQALAYTGSIKAQQDRLDSRTAERNLRIIDRRTELLAVGETWAQHLAWRNTNVGLMHTLDERIPEPDAPVLMQEYSSIGRTLFVIAAPDISGDRLVVLTALTEPR